MNELTQKHRGQQLLLRRATVAQLTRLWPTLDWTRLDATYPAFAVSVAKLVQTNRQTSAGLAAAYLRAFRRSQGVPGEAKAVFAQPLIVDQFATSLRVTSVAAIKTAAQRGVLAPEAMSAALTQTQGSVARLVLNAGRETAMQTILADDAAVGYQRVLGGGGCDWCIALVGKGVVYKSEATADFAAHDHCGCGVQAEYSDDVKTVRAYTPSSRFKTQAARDKNNARIRNFLAEKQG